MPCSANRSREAGGAWSASHGLGHFKPLLPKAAVEALRPFTRTLLSAIRADTQRLRQVFYAIGRERASGVAGATLEA